MVFNFRLRRTLAWWMLAVMLLGALTPTVSRARAAVNGATSVTWMEVCTAQGMTQVAALEDDGAPTTAVVVDHCPLCVLGLDRLAPPPEPLVWLGLPQGPPPSSHLTAPRALASRPWAVQSRAPPIFF